MKLKHPQVNPAIHLETCGEIICMKYTLPAGKHEGNNVCYYDVEAVGNLCSQRWTTIQKDPNIEL